MKTSLFLAFLAIAPCQGDVRLIAPILSIEVKTGLGFIVKAEKINNEVDIQISRQGKTLRVPAKETKGLDIGLSSCELRISEADFPGDFPKEFEILLTYGGPSDSESMWGTVKFRFNNGKYVERTRVNLSSKGPNYFIKPIGEPEKKVNSKVNPDAERDPFQ